MKRALLHKFTRAVLPFIALPFLLSACLPEDKPVDVSKDEYNPEPLRADSGVQPQTLPPVPTNESLIQMTGVCALQFTNKCAQPVSAPAISAQPVGQCVAQNTAVAVVGVTQNFAQAKVAGSSVWFLRADLSCHRK
jgi:hypothetical protein